MACLYRSDFHERFSFLLCIHVSGGEITLVIFFLDKMVMYNHKFIKGD